VKVVTAHALKSITQEGACISSLTTTDGSTHHGREFIDATYEGDLMAAAKDSYIVGRQGGGDAKLSCERGTDGG